MNKNNLLTAILLFFAMLFVIAFGTRTKLSRLALIPHPNTVMEKVLANYESDDEDEDDEDEEDDDDEDDDDDDDEEYEEEVVYEVVEIPVVPVPVTPRYITVIDSGYDIDTDGDKLVDAIDPHPTINEYELFTDDDNDGVPNATDQYKGENDFLFVDFTDTNNNGILDSFEY